MSVQWKYVSALKDESLIDQVQIQYAFRIPDDLKDCIRKNNGGTPSPSTFDFGENKNKVFGGLLSFNEGEPDSIYDYAGMFREKGEIGVKMLPFGIDPAGNLICVRDGKIVFYDHETDEVFPICDTFTDLLSMLHDVSEKAE
jgi:hypothetical protein